MSAAQAPLFHALCCDSTANCQMLAPAVQLRRSRHARDCVGEPRVLVAVCCSRGACCCTSEPCSKSASAGAAGCNSSGGASDVRKCNCPRNISGTSPVSTSSWFHTATMKRFLVADGQHVPTGHAVASPLDPLFDSDEDGESDAGERDDLLAHRSVSAGERWGILSPARAGTWVDSSCGAGGWEAVGMRCQRRPSIIG